MKFCPSVIPFSSYGCRLSMFQAEGTLVLQNVRRHRATLFNIRELTAAGNAHDFTNTETTVSELAAEGGEGSARFTWENDRTLLVSSTGTGLRWDFHPDANGFGTQRNHHFRFYSSKAQAVLNVQVLAGECRADFRRSPDGPLRRTVVKSASLEVRPDASGKIRMRVCICDQEEEPSAETFDFGKSKALVEEEWRLFYDRTPEDLRGEHAQRAWYNLWSSTLRAEGFFAHDGILMSKATMTGIWSWDHCFNGLALGMADTAKGIEQVVLPFSLQAANGALPDVWQVSHARWIYSKPPVHGWTLARLLPAEYPPEDLAWIYERVAKITEWWFDFRTPDGFCLPSAIHPNDGGWDNTTLFDAGVPIAAPEISAFLALQMEWLADAAQKLGLEAAVAWRERSESLIRSLIQELWHDGQFCGRIAFSGELVKAPHSLETCMPVLLGRRLPKEIFEALAKRIDSDFSTDFGPATESPLSPLYLENGYWRGPVWAPSTLLVVEGLRDGGACELADRLAQAFCHTVEASGGFYENYSASDGRGLCDMGYTWTAAVYLLLKKSLPEVNAGSR